MTSYFRVAVKVNDCRLFVSDGECLDLSIGHGIRIPCHG